MDSDDWGQRRGVPSSMSRPLMSGTPGYVSRYHAKDSARHVVLGTQQFQPTEFASQINLSHGIGNAWGILRCVIDICRKLERRASTSSSRTPTSK
ncbi:hypothetical protein J4Q44_G00176530 [Coregonus suidteri]|uniref:Uncharacterized protein n=1 Tax=Coregonus suidteri TaxID=861788 RepID=A0AAN8QQ06_9TELE